MRLLPKLVGSKIDPSTYVVARYTGRLEATDPVGKAAVGDGVPNEAVEVCGRIVLRDGRTLAELLAAERIRPMETWLRAEGKDPIPRALFRLFHDTIARGERPIDQAGIVLYWNPGVPPKSTYDGPSALAQMLGVAIKLYYAPASTEGTMVVDFEP